MEKKRKIVQYRERLDRTLALPDLTNIETLKKLVKSQRVGSSEIKVEGYDETAVDMKTTEVSQFLDMLRSASSDNSGKSNNTSHTDWHLKQDNEEFRVMYREGPEGTPFHTLLVEGFVDAPLDVCLCISWETSLYKKWWPQSVVPTFKILSCERLHEVEIGEHMSLVRVKVSWPLSMREAVLHYYLFEYFQDDLIVALTNSIAESKSVHGALNGFNDDIIPEANDVVRIDLVGGFALQKVTSERSYFRTITNMDIKLDFVPPSLINFVSRQLVGNGFRLYKKALASMMNQGDEELIKALGGPLYVRIRESLYGINGSKAKDGEELKQVAKILPKDHLIESKQDGAKDEVSQDDKTNQCENNVMSMEVTGAVLDNSKVSGEIEEVDSEDIVQRRDDYEEMKEIPNEEVDSSIPKGARSAYISLEVEQALETLEKAISVVRQYKLHSRVASPSFPNEKSPSVTNGGQVGSPSEKLVHQSSKNEVADEAPNRDTQGVGAFQETSDIQNFSYTGMNSNKVTQVLPKNLSSPVEATRVTLENGETQVQTKSTNKQQPIVDSFLYKPSDDPSNKEKINTFVVKGETSDVPKKPRRQRRNFASYCCFLH